MHKGNIMKFTEGAFKDWGYEVAKAGVPRPDRHRGRGHREARRQGARRARWCIKDRIADSMFQQMLLRPDEYSVIATPTSTATTSPTPAPRRWAAWAWRRAPTSATQAAMFEATHGTAPEIRRPEQGQPRQRHFVRRV